MLNVDRLSFDHIFRRRSRCSWTNFRHLQTKHRDSWGFEATIPHELPTATPWFEQSCISGWRSESPGHSSYCTTINADHFRSPAVIKLCPSQSLLRWCAHSVLCNSNSSSPPLGHLGFWELVWIWSVLKVTILTIFENFKLEYKVIPTVLERGIGNPA